MQELENVELKYKKSLKHLSLKKPSCLWVEKSVRDTENNELS